jgi:hypothetical protein
MITPGLNLISNKYHVSLDTVNAFMLGMLAFWTGFTTFFTSSGATIWGKRPFFIISAVLLLITCIWGYFATVSDCQNLEDSKQLIIPPVFQISCNNESNSRYCCGSFRDARDSICSRFVLCAPKRHKASYLGNDDRCDSFSSN